MQSFLRLRLLRVLHLLHLDLLAMDSECRQMRGRGIRSFLWHGNTHLLPPSLHLLLHRNLQERQQETNWTQTLTIDQLSQGSQGCTAPRHSSSHPRRNQPRDEERPRCHHWHLPEPPCHTITKGISCEREETTSRLEAPIPTSD
jgi:hypothetical protein